MEAINHHSLILHRVGIWSTQLVDGCKDSGHIVVESQTAAFVILGIPLVDKGKCGWLYSGEEPRQYSWCSSPQSARYQTESTRMHIMTIWCSSPSFKRTNLLFPFLKKKKKKKKTSLLLLA